EDGIRDRNVTGVQTCALPISTAGLLAKLLNLAFNAITAGLVTWHATRTDLLGPRAATSVAAALVTAAALAIPMLAMQAVLFSERSEERRVGEECRQRWTTYG